MSLINDMLKDLDRRNHRPAVAHAAALQGLGLAGTNMRSPPARRFIALGGAGLLVTAVLAAVTINHAGRLQHAQATPDTRTEVAAVRAPRLQNAPPALRAEPAATDVSVHTTPAAIETPAVTDSTREAQLPDTPAPVDAPAGAKLSASATVAEITSHLEVTPRPLSRKQQLARDFHAAATAVNNGNPVAAEQLLEDLLIQDNGQHQARLLLAGLYLQQQRNSRAESVLASGLLHFPQHAPYAKLQAQLLADQARDSEAINALQTALPGAGDDAEYHALLAGLYQRSGKPGAAATGYRDALRLAPAHGEWWMGLGISSEQAGDADTAATAYRQALHYPLSAALQQYVQQRLQQLTY